MERRRGRGAFSRDVRVGWQRRYFYILPLFSIVVMRCFIAIEAPKELFSFQKEFNTPGIKLVDYFHLTLVFLGDISEVRAEEICKKLSTFSFPKFSLHLSGLGAFPNTRHPQIIWVGLQNCKELQDIKEKMEGITGIKEKRDFVPHITIGRVKFLEDKEGIQKKLKLPISGSFEVKEVCLFKSTLTQRGPIYDVLGKASSP